eukprot:CAMPEP_0181185026 /NCGR_PEP_ID=MMETSP1096-20121128/9286_1 /TAXON_ID=156174 ORGANISM="Chrysochromulina ericina, Strain CCMP281" /NCGR_SAMPLE_ID=MMETSP1096 /ASSEMBLY_ACC=CAM_ASM_000453 /LENGTH=59 /DNA_ID=CAMNT_0023273839 /DNA_START=818 /DNA_END=997 /DNA_ORIENTATION=-
MRVQVLRDGDIHLHRLSEAVGEEEHMVVDQQFAHRVQVWKEAPHQTGHLRVVPLTVSHL